MWAEREPRRRGDTGKQGGGKEEEGEEQRAHMHLLTTARATREKHAHRAPPSWTLVPTQKCAPWPTQAPTSMQTSRPMRTQSQLRRATWATESAGGTT